MDKPRSYAEAKSRNKLGPQREERIGHIPNRESQGFTLNSQVMLLPDITDKDERSFMGDTRTKATLRLSQVLKWNSTFHCMRRSGDWCRELPSL